MSLLSRIFTKILHIMISQNPKKSNVKKISFLFILRDVMLEYICPKNTYVRTYSKMKINSINDSNDF
jgi:hypothetical protein